MDNARALRSSTERIAGSGYEIGITHGVMCEDVLQQLGMQTRRFYQVGSLIPGLLLGQIW